MIMHSIDLENKLKCDENIEQRQQIGLKGNDKRWALDELDLGEAWECCVSFSNCAVKESVRESSLRHQAT